MWAGARSDWTGVCYTNSREIATSEWTLNLVREPPVKMAGFVIYLIDVCNWNDDVVRHYQVTMTNSSAKDIIMLKYTNLVPAIFTCELDVSGTLP